MDAALKKILGPLETLKTRLHDSGEGPLLAGLLIANAELRAEAAAILKDLPAPTAPESLWYSAAASHLEDEEVDQAIDEALENDESAEHILAGLFRGGTEWHHDRLATYVTDENNKALATAAAFHLATAEPDELLAALEQIDDERHLLEVLRAVALAGEEDYFDFLLELRQDLDDELDAREMSQLDALLATVDPTRFTRTFLAGELDNDWLGDDRPVADFLTSRGTSDWVDVLAVFRTVRDRDGFELAATFALAAALTESFDDVDDDTLATLEAATVSAQTPERVAFQLAQTEEDELTELLIETTLHQARLERGLATPPIPGLPLSSGPIPIEHLQALLAELAKAGTIPQRVVLVRTLTDLRRLVQEEEISREEAAPILELFENHSDDALRQLVEAFDDQEAFGDVSDWGCRGLYFLHRQFTRPADEALRELARGWFYGPLERAPLYRVAFLATLEALAG